MSKSLAKRCRSIPHFLPLPNAIYIYTRSRRPPPPVHQQKSQGSRILLICTQTYFHLPLRRIYFREGKKILSTRQTWHVRNVTVRCFFRRRSLAGGVWRVCVRGTREWPAANARLPTSSRRRRLSLVETPCFISCQGGVYFYLTVGKASVHFDKLKNVLIHQRNRSRASRRRRFRFILGTERAKRLVSIKEAENFRPLNQTDSM